MLLPLPQGCIWIFHCAYLRPIHFDQAAFKPSDPFRGELRFSAREAMLLWCWGKPLKNSELRIGAPSSRQPLVKGERLVRIDASAAMLQLESAPRLCMTLHLNRRVLQRHDRQIEKAGIKILAQQMFRLSRRPSIHLKNHTRYISVSDWTSHCSICCPEGRAVLPQQRCRTGLTPTFKRGKPRL